MAATNDFLPFASSSSANVQSQANYAASSWVTGGFSSGTASSAAVNKALRQGTTMASVLAQYIAKSSGANSVDDGTTATLLTNLTTSLQSMFSPVIGTSRNMHAAVAAGSTTCLFVGDGIVVGSALTGQTYRLANFSQTLNLASTGIGGMDTGSATAGSIIGVYAAYNPTTGAQGVFATLEGTSALSTIYSGSSLPSGYTATALIAVVPISSTAGQFATFTLRDRHVAISPISVLGGSSSGLPTSASYALVTLLGIPYSAISVAGYESLTNSGAANTHLGFAGQSNGVGLFDFANNSAAGSGLSATLGSVLLSSPRTAYYYLYSSSSSITASYNILINGYDF